MKSEMNGLRCVLVVRCSSKDQIEVSIDKQIEMGQDFAASNGMTVVDVADFPGYSASLGLHYDGLYKLIDRKKQKNDFDSLLFLCYDRFCRGGQKEGNTIAEDFAEAGIAIVSIREGLISGEMAWLQRGMILHQANKYVQDVSFNMAAGWEHSLELHRIPHSGRLPYGIDRLFLDAHEKPLFFIRDLPDGSRLKANAKTGQEIEIIPKGQNAPIRQASEKIVFIKGDPQCVAVVQSVFRRYFVDGWGYRRISLELNDKGIPAKYGGAWADGSIRLMIQNPIYIGYGYTNTQLWGVYHSRNSGQPIRHLVKRKRAERIDGCGLRKSLAGIPRPMREWLKIPQPLLDSYLEPEVKLLVIEYHKKNESETAPQNKRKSGGDRHLQSLFILKNVIQETNYQCGMSGWVGGSPSRIYRYYKVKATYHKPKTGANPRGLPAGLVEQTVLTVLRHVLPNKKLLQDRIATFVMSRQQANRMTQSERPKLLKEQNTISTELKEICSLGPNSQEVLKDRREQCEKRLGDIKRLMECLNDDDADAPKDINGIVNSVVSQLDEVLKGRKEATAAHLRRLIETFVPRISFDSVRETLEFNIQLPQWAMAKNADIKKSFSLMGINARISNHHANTENGLILATYGGRLRRANDPGPMSALVLEPSDRSLPSVSFTSKATHITVKFPNMTPVECLQTKVA